MLAMKKTLVQELEKLSVVSGAEVSCCFSCCLFSPGWHDRAKFSFVFLERYQEQALFSLLWGTPERGVHQVPFRFGHRLSVISHFFVTSEGGMEFCEKSPLCRVSVMQIRTLEGGGADLWSSAFF